MGVRGCSHRPVRRTDRHRGDHGDLGDPRDHLQRDHLLHQHQVLHRQPLRPHPVGQQRHLRSPRSHLRGAHLHHRHPVQLADRAGPGGAHLRRRRADALRVDPEAARGPTLHLPRASRRHPERGLRLLGPHRPGPAPRPARLPHARALGIGDPLPQGTLGVQRSGAADRVAGADPDDHPHHRLDDAGAREASTGPGP